MYSPSLSLTSALDGVDGQPHAPAVLPPGKTRYPLYVRGWVSPIAGGDGCGKFRPPPGFDPRTVQPVASPMHRLSYPDSRVQAGGHENA